MKRRRARLLVVARYEHGTDPDAGGRIPRHPEFCVGVFTEKNVPVFAFSVPQILAGRYHTIAFPEASSGEREMPARRPGRYGSLHT